MSRIELKQLLLNPVVLMFVVSTIGSAYVVQYRVSRLNEEVSLLRTGKDSDHERLVMISKDVEYTIFRIEEVRQMLRDHVGSSGAGAQNGGNGTGSSGRGGVNASPAAFDLRMADVWQRSARERIVAPHTITIHSGQSITASRAEDESRSKHVPIIEIVGTE